MIGSRGRGTATRLALGSTAHAFPAARAPPHHRHHPEFDCLFPLEGFVATTPPTGHIHGLTITKPVEGK